MRGNNCPAMVYFPWTVLILQKLLLAFDRISSIGGICSMNARTLFIASCVALVTSAFTFVIRGDILPDLKRVFTLTEQDLGWIAGGAFWGMAIAMLVGAPICDYLGAKLVLLCAFVFHMIGVAGVIWAPVNDWAFYTLLGATFAAGCGNGLVEIAINPLAATLYPKEKTHYLNILHAWWPGGLIIGGLLASYMGEKLNFGYFEVKGLGMNYKARMALIFVPGIIYMLMCLPQRFPATERVASGVSSGAMFREVFRPLFLLWAFCMVLTAASELGPQQWQNSVMMATTDGKVSGTLILVYTSAMMFVLRHFAGPIAHRLSPTGMLTGSAVLAGIGLYLLSFANNGATAFGYATIYGLGIAYFWPTMLGVTAERFPKGGAFLLGLMGCVGNVAIAVVLPVMGYLYDTNTVKHVPSEYVKTVPASWPLRIVGIRETQVIDTAITDATPAEKSAIDAGGSAKEEAEKAIADRKTIVLQAQGKGAAIPFRRVAILPAILVLIFGAITIYDWMRGGYKPEILISREEENELMSGGAQGPVE